MNKSQIQKILDYLANKGLYLIDKLPSFTTVYDTILRFYTYKKQPIKNKYTILQVNKIKDNYSVISFDNISKKYKRSILMLENEDLISLLKDCEYSCKRSLEYINEIYKFKKMDNSQLLYFLEEKLYNKNYDELIEFLHKNEKITVQKNIVNDIDYKTTAFDCSNQIIQTNLKDNYHNLIEQYTFDKSNKSEFLYENCLNKNMYNTIKNENNINNLQRNINCISDHYNANDSTEVGLVEKQPINADNNVATILEHGLTEYKNKNIIPKLLIDNFTQDKFNNLDIDNFISNQSISNDEKLKNESLTNLFLNNNHSMSSHNYYSENKSKCDSQLIKHNLNIDNNYLNSINLDCSNEIKLRNINNKKSRMKIYTNVNNEISDLKKNPILKNSPFNVNKHESFFLNLSLSNFEFDKTNQNKNIESKILFNNIKKRDELLYNNINIFNKFLEDKAIKYDKLCNKNILCDEKSNNSLAIKYQKKLDTESSKKNIFSTNDMLQISMKKNKYFNNFNKYFVINTNKGLLYSQNNKTCLNIEHNEKIVKKVNCLIDEKSKNLITKNFTLIDKRKIYFKENNIKKKLCISPIVEVSLPLKHVSKKDFLNKKNLIYKEKCNQINDKNNILKLSNNSHNIITKNNNIYFDNENVNINCIYDFNYSKDQKIKEKKLQTKIDSIDQTIKDKVEEISENRNKISKIFNSNKLNRFSTMDYSKILKKSR